MQKQALSRSIVDDSLGEKRNFTNKELRELFKLTVDTTSNTHDLIGCECLGALDGLSKKDQNFGVTFSEDDGWKHYDDTVSSTDPAVSKIDNSFTSEFYSSNKLISFIFAHQTKDLSDLPKPEEADASPKDFLGYESDDFVDQATIKKKITVEVKKEQADPITTDTKPKRRRLKKIEQVEPEITIDSLLDEEDDEMLELLEFSDEDEE